MPAADPGDLNWDNASLSCRVSTTDQSCERQERDLTAFAAHAGYEIIGIYKEMASGLKLDSAAGGPQRIGVPPSSRMRAE